VLEMFFAESDASLSVREVTVREALSELFEITIVAVSEDASLDLEGLVGRAAGVRSTAELALRLQSPRLWTGVCSFIEQVAAEPTGLSTYHLRIVPAFWLLTQRRNYRIFQHQSVPEIVRSMLAEWNLESTWKIDASRYPKLEYRVQFGESDHAFVSRLLEEAGIGYALVAEGRATRIHFDDAPQSAERRGGPPVRFFDRPMGWRDAEFVNEVRIAHDVRPGAHLIRDYDFRNPAFPLYGQSTTAQAMSPEQARLEQYHYSPGAFLVETSQGSGTPTADDKAFARHLPGHGADLATRSLAQDRLGRRSVRFATNAPDIAPGVVFAISGHPQAELSEEHELLVVESSFRWTEGNEPTLEARAVFAAEPWRPARVTPRPVVAGVQSATVVGPAGQEIHVDEFGRVRVEFPWDRESRGDENSSSWIRVSQGWAGTGYGVLVLPRIGQEVLVGFLEGNPDQPVVVGRVFNAVQAVPYALPEHKTRSTWKSDSSLGSNGFNEILFEDLKGQELVYVQAEKNLRKLVKNDETITIGNDREKLVHRHELETTGGDRTEVTRGSRKEITFGDRETTVWGSRKKRVEGDESEQTNGSRAQRVGGDLDVVVERTKRERVDGDAHLVVAGERREMVEQKSSLVVGGDMQARVGGHHGLEANAIHLKSSGALVIESATDLCFKGPGGFVRIDAGGVTIRGTLVRINSGGEAGEGPGVSADAPAEAKQIELRPSEPPETDDIFQTGLAQ